ncbi:MarR family winged helix-turn-helix transcriptional regulator [Enterovibrio nigricans]|uniref:DNA-binding transcriptional regulator, MarR family n=1 Tax=Enterovibrio nigricans DSM 22720 TaxID=1121868 RepID=A0A1T4V9D1_9GAMM|nr:MarR family transcriptional regulator [Enterovibrio nigricans]PKF50149.1 MarR family transcriptional regulator [Enterovibrio nigricans]SKA61486.1 DNA-binding transcriptional regulator, MarR family [Enterovibrio nigricans DSM 22720]
MSLQLLSLDNFLPYKLVQTAELVADSLASRYEGEFGISRPEWRVIASLGARDGVISRDLAKETRLDKVKVSRILSRLEAKRLVERAVHEDDQRAAIVRLSESGNALYAQVVPKVLEWERAMLDGLSNEQYQTLYQALDALQARSYELT